jgi:hypothetical protein
MAIYVGVITNPVPNILAAYTPESVYNEPGGFTKDNFVCFAQLISISTPTPSLLDRYKVTGVITENSIPVKRTIRLYRHSTGEVVDETESDISGNYELTTAYNERHYVVCLSLDVGQSYNHLIRKDVEIVNI